MAKKKSAKKKAAEAPKLVSVEYLEMAWERRTLPVPELLQKKLQAFDEWAQQLLQAETLQVPSRVELSHVIGETTPLIVTQPLLRQVVDWLLEPCTSQAQGQRIRYTMEILPHSRWILEHPVLDFLMHRWSEQMPENCAQWVPLWCGLLGEARWPSPSISYMENLTRAMHEEKAPPMTPHIPEFDQVYSWWIISGLVLGWHRAPEAFRDALADRALEEWLASHPGFMARPERANYPATHKWEEVEALLLVNELLSELLPDEAFDDFLVDPASGEWALEVAQTMQELGKPEQARGMLEQLAERFPERTDIQELLKNV